MTDSSRHYLFVFELDRLPYEPGPSEPYITSANCYECWQSEPTFSVGDEWDGLRVSEELDVDELPNDAEAEARSDAFDIFWNSVEGLHDNCLRHDHMVPNDSPTFRYGITLLSAYVLS